MTLHVRDARPSDAPIIVDFNIRLALESEDVRLEPAVIGCGVEKLLKDSSLGRYFVAEDPSQDGRLLGQVMVTYEWSDWRDGLFWWIQSVFVAEDARERRVFSTLHDHVRAEAARAGAIGLRLYVHDGNTRAHEVYRRRGMHDSGYRVLEELFPRR